MAAMPTLEVVLAISMKTVLTLTLMLLVLYSAIATEILAQSTLLTQIGAVAMILIHSTQDQCAAPVVAEDLLTKKAVMVRLVAMARPEVMAKVRPEVMARPVVMIILASQSVTVHLLL